MRDINNTTITGRLASNIELKHTPNGTAYTEFRVAVNDRVKGEDCSYADRPNFIPVKVWQGQAEACAKSLVKGQRSRSPAGSGRKAGAPRTSGARGFMS